MAATWLWSVPALAGVAAGFGALGARLEPAGAGSGGALRRGRNGVKDAVGWVSAGGNWGVGGVCAWSAGPGREPRGPFWAIPVRLLRVCSTPPVVIADPFASALSGAV